jgi:hypothetical protein
MSSFARALRNAESELMRGRHVQLARQRVAAKIDGRDGLSGRSRMFAGYAVGAALCTAGAWLAWEAVDQLQPEPAAPTVVVSPEPKSTAPASKGSDDDPKVEKGTLVAIAIGGSCGFSVNGDFIARRSSIRKKLPVGHYTVTCTPDEGAAMFQSVIVAAGKPGIASFRIP